MLDRQSRSLDPTSRILDNPNFQALVRERSTFGWTLSAIMLAVYLVFIFLAAFGKGVMAATIGGTSVSCGILLGLATILFAFAITGVYVWRANGRFDDLTERLQKDLGR